MEKNIPYTEIDNTNPINFYGLSKLKGEEVIIDSGCKYLIIRTSWVYGDYGNNFPNSILKKASQSKDLNVVNDQLGSPTHVDLISDVTEICIKEKIHNSLYHLCANGCVTWYEFANFLVKGIHERGIQLKCSPDNVWPKESRPSKSIALRPKNSVLNCDKIENEIKKSLPEWQYHANHYLDNWAKNYE